MSSARRLSFIAVVVHAVACLGAVVIVATVPFAVVDRACQPQPEGGLELCVEVREPTPIWGFQFLVTVLVALAAVAGVVVWRSWRDVCLVGNVPKQPWRERGRSTRAVWVMPAGALALTLLSVGQRTDRTFESVGPICNGSASATFCRTTSIEVERIVSAGLPVAGVVRVGALLVLLGALVWWAYVVIAENFARRFGESNLWAEAYGLWRKERRESYAGLPGHPERKDKQY